jgi:hypothetical protein
MSKPLFDQIPFAKITVILASVLTVSLGLCGLTWLMVSGSNRSGEILVGLGMLELAAIVLSLVGLLLTLLLFVTLWLFRGRSEEVSQLKITTSGETNTKSDENE